MSKLFSSPTIRAGGNAKTLKGDKRGVYKTAIMYLAPATMAGGTNLCPMATLAGCNPTHGGGCLVKAGRASYQPAINVHRIAKTQRYLSDRTAFMAELVRDIEAFSRHCERENVLPACRLNGTSDIQFEVAHPCYRDMGTKRVPNIVRFDSIFDAFPGVQFYDYTKIYKRVQRPLPVNYHLTLSYSAANQRYADAVLNAALDTGVNIAIVYRTKALRNAFIAEGAHALGTIGFGLRAMRREVIDGDETDMRFADARGVIVGLYAKGKDAKADTTGFVLG